MTDTLHAQFNAVEIAQNQDAEHERSKADSAALQEIVRAAVTVWEIFYRAVGPAMLAVALLIAAPAHARMVAIDGDTLIETVTMERIRLENVDAPELRARCPEEAHLAQRAKEFVAFMLARHGGIVHPVGRVDRYGRTLALVEIRGHGDLGRMLIDAKLARAYHGGKRAGWC